MIQNDQGVLEAIGGRRSKAAQSGSMLENISETDDGLEIVTVPFDIQKGKVSHAGSSQKQVVGVGASKKDLSDMMSGLEEVKSGLGVKTDSASAKLEEMKASVSTLKTNLETHIEQFNNSITENKTILNELKESVDAMTAELVTIQLTLVNHEERIDVLEA